MSSQTLAAPVAADSAFPPPRALPARESPRMHAGQLPSPLHRRFVLVVAALGIGLSLLPGCRNSDGYDDSMTFPVLSDLIVYDPISQTTPTGFNPPGHTPLDALKLPPAEVGHDTVELRNEMGRNLFDPADLKPERRAEYAQLLGEMF